MKNIIEKIELIAQKNSKLLLTIKDSQLTILYFYMEYGFESRPFTVNIPDGKYIVKVDTFLKFAKNNDFMELVEKDESLYLQNKNRKMRLAVFVNDILKDFKFNHKAEFGVTIFSDIRKDIASLNKFTTIINVNKAYEGVLFDEENMVSVDIHRVHLVEGKISTPKPFVVSQACQKVLAKIEPKNFQVSTDDTTILTTDEGRFFFKNIKNEFPNYMAVYGDRSNQERIDNISTKFDKKELIKELKIMIDILKLPKQKVVSCKYEDGVFYGYNDDENYEFKFNLAMNRSFGFNAIYLKQALEVIDEPLITTTEGVRPVEIFDQNIRHLVMPLRV